MLKRKLVLLWAAAAVVLAGALAFMRPQPSLPVIARAGVPLPVIMYHSVLKDEARQGDYVVSPNVIKKDFAYLKERGYQAVGTQQILDFVQKGAPLPEKPVLITFDDGYYNNLLYLPPILEKYQYPAVISIVGEYVQRFTDSPDQSATYGHMSWAEVNQLLSCKYAEIGNHSYMLHHQGKRRGASRMVGEPWEAYSQMLKDDTLRMQTAILDNTGVSPILYAYPYGQISDGADGLIAELGYKITLSCYERVSVLTDNESCLLSLGRYNRGAKYTTEQFMERVGIK